MDLRQTQEYANYLRGLNWTVEEKGGVYYFIKRIPLLGSVIKVQRPGKIDFEYIDKLAKRHRAFQIVLEPMSSVIGAQIPFHKSKPNSTGIRPFVHKSIINAGFKLASSSYLPTKTTVIALSKSESTLLKNMHYKTRYNIKKAKENKLQIKITDDIKSFADFWQSCALKQRGMYISQKNEIITMHKAFKNRCSLVFVFPPSTPHRSLLTSSPISAVFSVYTADTSFYMFAAADKVGKKLFAPTLAAWESIKLAKKKGLKYYDFEGIYDERFPLPSWRGFSRFKISFGGETIEYPGSYVKMKLPI